MTEKTISTLEAMIEAIPLPFGLRTIRGDDIVHVVDNRAAAQLLGCSPDETRGRTARELGLPPERVRSCIGLLNRAREQRQTLRMPTRYETAHGVREMICHTTLLDPQGDLFACFVEDVTDVRRLESLVAHADRLASVGTMTAALLHDVSGPAMASILLLQESLDLVHRAENGAPLSLAMLHEDLQNAHDGVGQILEIVRSIRAYTRPLGDGAVAACDFNAVVRSALRMARAELVVGATVSFERGDIPPVRGGAVRLGQVVLNLLANAIRAATLGNPGGTGRVVIRTDTSGGGRVRLQISDNGAGLPANQKTLFEPFATMHEDSGGSGLGLFISRRIIESFGGTIDLSNSPDPGHPGATATVTLPASEEPA